MTYKEKKHMVRLRKTKRTVLFLLVLITFPISFPLIADLVTAESPDSSTQYNAMLWNDYNNLM